MANCVKTFNVSLQQDGFCVATGPEDSSIVYPCPAKPFAPVLLKSPVVLHLYCPNLFSGEVLKLHAEHLGHFLALQKVPRIDDAVERALFLGLCRLFTREKVLSVYAQTYTNSKRVEMKKEREEKEHDENDKEGDEDNRRPEGDDASEESEDPSVFVHFSKSKASQIVALLRNLLDLFDLNELCESEIQHVHGQEPQHMLFLYLIQLLAIFVSRCIGEKDLATIMSIASAPFLEVNFGEPLCAATLLRPMFVPFFQPHPTHWGKKARKGNQAVAETDCHEPEQRLIHYRLFTGYELDETGSDVSCSGDAVLRWTDHDLQQRMQDCRLAESKGKKLWFVAPQMGDRMTMVEKTGLQLMGGQTGERARKICSYMMSDNVIAYMQCAVFGTIRNMLPCHANSELSEAVTNTIEGSMAKFSEVVRHQSSSLLKELGILQDSCLYTSGVGFAGQEKGSYLSFGKVFTGPEEKRPTPDLGKPGTFTSVTMGVSNETMMTTMLNFVLAQEVSGDKRKNQLREMLSRGYRSPGIVRTVTDTFFYARYNHRFNAGEFTEVACVKPMSEPNFNALIHEESLSANSKYQMTASHGALPMCMLTLALTLRQTVVMIMGFLCAELARLIYSPKMSESSLCKQLISISTAAKFRHGKDEDGTNAFEAYYGRLVKFTGPAFGKAGTYGPNYSELDSMEWLRTSDERLPEYLRRSLNVIGDTKSEVQTIMRERNLSYNRVLFVSGVNVMPFASTFGNEKYMIHAPLMVMSTLRVFSGNQTYGSVKLSRKRCYYRVHVFSNRCVDTELYQTYDTQSFPRPPSSTIEELLAKIKREVSIVLPSIEMDRIKMIAPELSEEELSALVSAVRNSNIKVIVHERERGTTTSGGQKAGVDRKRVDREVLRGDCASPKKCRFDSGQPPFAQAHERSFHPEFYPGEKRENGEMSEGESPIPCESGDEGDLTLCQTKDVVFVFNE